MAGLLDVMLKMMLMVSCTMMYCAGAHGAVPMRLLFSWRRLRMSRDTLVDEVRKQRAEILKSYDWDFERMSRDVMKRQWQSGHRVVSRAHEPLRHDAGQAAADRRSA